MERCLFVRSGQFFDSVQDFGSGGFSPLRESISGIAIGAAKIAGGKTNKDAGQPGPGAFALKTQVNFIDCQCVGHPAKCSRNRLIAKARISRLKFNDVSVQDLAGL